MGNMNIRETLTAKRLRLAMKPLERYETPVFIRTTFDWRIGAILGAGKWAPVFTIDIMSRTLASYTTWRAAANLLKERKWVI